MSTMNAVSKIEEIYPRADLRVYAKWICFSRSVATIANFVYPHLFELEEKEPLWGTIDGDFVRLPSRLPLSGGSLSHNKVYLFVSYQGLYMIVGKNLETEQYTRLFGVPTIVNAVHAASLSLREDEEDDWVLRIWNVIQSLREQYGEHLQLRIILRGEKEMNQVAECFYDDRVKMDGTISEFVCDYFKKIVEKYT